MNANSHIGNVIRILSNSALIIDVGNDSISVGDKIQVYEDVGEVVGVNGENLGPLTYVKAELRVTRTENKYSICETPTRKVTTNPVFSGILSKGTTVERHYTFDVDPGVISPMQPTSKKVCVGDYVKLAK